MRAMPQAEVFKGPGREVVEPTVRGGLDASR